MTGWNVFIGALGGFSVGLGCWMALIGLALEWDTLRHSPEGLTDEQIERSRLRLRRNIMICGALIAIGGACIAAGFRLLR